MTKFAYVATGAGRASSTKGVEKADSREAAELALYDRELRDIRRHREEELPAGRRSSGPRVKREEVMHLSRQLGAFIRAGLPLLDAVHTLGEESQNSSVRRMMADIEDGLRSRRHALRLPGPASRRSSPSSTAASSARPS